MQFYCRIGKKIQQESSTCRALDRSPKPLAQEEMMIWPMIKDISFKDSLVLALVGTLFSRNERSEQL